MTDDNTTHIGPVCADDGSYALVAKCDTCGRGYTMVNRRAYEAGLQCKVTGCDGRIRLEQHHDR